MPVTFSNTTFSAGESSTGAFALGNFTGTNTLSGAAPVTINGTINNPGSTVQVGLNIGGVTSAGAQGTYLGYSAIPNTQDYVYYFNVTGANLVTPVTIAVTPATALPTLSSQPVTTTNVTAPISASAACFATGTHIRTPRGDVRIEELAVGDLVVTATGEERPVRWIGRRRTDCASHHNPLEVMPVRIRAGAFGTNLPQADLLLSPGHRLYVNDALVHVDHLVNGWSIAREFVDEITYWHVELDSHDALLAEGLPAETFIDMGNRSAFDNGGSVVLMQPDLDAMAREDGRLAPVLGEGPELTAIKRGLMDRARSFGARYTPDAGLSLVADGLQLTPVAIEGDLFRFEVPEGTGDLRLLSRAAVAAEVNADSDDRRRLGIQVRELIVDGHRISMDAPVFGIGWHLAEDAMGARARWTKGEAWLPVGRTIEFRIQRMGCYSVGQPDPFERTVSRTAARLRAVA